MKKLKRTILKRSVLKNRLKILGKIFEWDETGHIMNY
jgi:hypothetical protein